MESFEHNHSEIIPARGASIIGLDDQLQLRTPASMSASHDDIECIRVASHPPTSIKILPVIQSSSYIKHDYGKLTSLEPDLLDIILKSLDALAASDRFAIVSLQSSRALHAFAQQPRVASSSSSGGGEGSQCNLARSSILHTPRPRNEFEIPRCLEEIGVLNAQTV
jgi:hypothetical protein